jgi:hypothetical protein
VGVSQPDTEPPGGESPGGTEACAAEDRRAAVETGGMGSDPIADTPPPATCRDVPTGGMGSDPIEDPDDEGS